MADLIFVLVIVAFFAMAALFVKLCDRIIGSDEEAFEGSTSIADDEPQRTAA